MTLTLAGYIDAYGRTQHPSAYGGLVVSDGRAHIAVYLTTLEDVIMNSYNSLASEGTLRFVPTPHSLQFLLALQQRVSSDAPSLRSRGIRIVGSSPRVQTGMLELTVVDPSAADAAVLNSLFGKNNINISSVGPEGLGGGAMEDLWQLTSSSP